MPLWEHVPDGEPRVFEYNGEKRVYVYGSHDSLRTEYCGPDYVVWSAPVDDLTDWVCHGVCYEATDQKPMYAPDVVQKGEYFYLYAAEDHNSKIMVAKSKNPAGPFIDPIKTEVGCDVGVLVDDDDRVYAFWGFCSCYCAELNDDMATIKKGTLHEHPIGHCDTHLVEEREHIDYNDGFYEASSIRKINGKYVFIYSKYYNVPIPEYGVDAGCNGFLSYKYSDKPLEGYRAGGDIILNGGEIISLGDGTGKMTYRWGNNHGSIMEINGKWYVFYHRQTGTNEYARQAMMEPIDIAVDKDGKLLIGNIIYADGRPVSSRPVEMTSQGAQINGLDAYKMISAGYACHISGSSAQTYIAPVYEKSDTISAPIKNITNGTTVGFRYLQFGMTEAKTVSIQLETYADIIVNVRIDDYKGRIVAILEPDRGKTETTAALESGITGKHAVYFEFLAKADGAVAEFDMFTFD